MKKSSLTTAVVAGIVGAAGLVSVSNAVNINPDGLGQALIYPYYTVNKGNSTLISVVNTTNLTKAVKVRFLEGRNSNEVLDFNLYLSPFDVWTAAVISSGPEGTDPAAAPPARLITSDRSCTVPAIPADGVDFVNFEYARFAETTGAKTDGPFNLSRTREGHIEIIEMGVVNNVAGNAAAQFASFAKHNSAGVPANCGALDAAWRETGLWAGSNGDLGLETPNGGLFGGAEIVNPAIGTNISYNATAIEGFFASPDLGLNLHFEPGSTSPTLAQAQTDDAGNATAIVFNNGTLTAFPFTGDNAGLRAVSAVFMHNEIFNEFSSVDPVSSSEWVITFPTKRLHIQSADAGVRLPFRQQYDIRNGGACEPISIRFWDREEREPTTPPGGTDFSPRPTTPTVQGPSLCYEAQIVTFNQSGIGDYLTGGSRSDLFGSYYARNINTRNAQGMFAEGWARITLGNQSATSATQNFLPLAIPSTPADNPGLGRNQNALVGLPVAGFWAANFAGGATAGVLANYSLVHNHRADRLTAGVDVSLDGTNPIWRVPATSPL
jgi:hypothetical protein